jgi:cytidylate kinase
MMIPNTITIDGPAASGKSTLGLKLAQALGFLFFDTGVMYRAVTCAALDQHIPIEDEKAITDLANHIQIDVRPPSISDERLSDVLINGKDVTWEIRTSEVEANVSAVSAYRGVRKALSEQQRRIGLRGKVVMVGRDIGTVVLPDAEHKFYLDASVEVRAKRRFEELRGRNEPAVYQDILNAMQRRDQIDTTRAIAPLRAADDAVILDSDHLDAEQVLEYVRRLIA